MAQHRSRWCRKFGDWTIGTSSQNGDFDDRTIGTSSQNGGFGDPTINDHYRSDISMTRPPTPVNKTSSSITRLLTPVAAWHLWPLDHRHWTSMRCLHPSNRQHRSPVRCLLPPDCRRDVSCIELTAWVVENHTGDLATRCERGSHCVFFENVLPNFQK